MEHAYGLYTHIQANKRRSIALLIGLFFLIAAVVQTSPPVPAHRGATLASPAPETPPP